MSPDLEDKLRRDLLEDFYLECDELLTAYRQGLIHLEASPAAAEALIHLESLFRSTHSLKGIAAIAGVRTAEELAHSTEDLLRLLNKQPAVVTPERLKLLSDSGARLEQIIHAHRTAAATPATTDLLEALQTTTQDASASAEPPRPEPLSREAPPAPEPPLEVSENHGAPTRVFSFTPSRLLDARGVNITSVRQRLESIGEVVKVVPRVESGGTMRFVLEVRLRSPGSIVAPPDWEADGIRLERGPTAPQEAASAAPEAAVVAPGRASLSSGHVIRVDLERMDELMRLMGELVIQRSRLEDRIHRQFNGAPELQEINAALAKTLRDFRRAVVGARMVPMGEIFARVPLVIRDLGLSPEAQPRVVIHGEDTRIDKYIAERVREPLLHLVRNAFSHGIEPPAVRVAAGKPDRATLSLRARSTGETVLVEVQDDGAGIDTSAVVARARAFGMQVADSPGAEELLEILCASGFSMRDHADRVAGRGMGMAIVEQTVRELGGHLALRTTLGQGTLFTLRLPLTLSIADAIIFSLDGETCAIPSQAVQEVMQVPAMDARRIGDTEVVPYQGGLLPFSRLRSLFSLPPVEQSVLTLVVLGSERGAAGLAVDRIHSRREIVMKPMADPLVRVPAIMGATELGDGRPVLILNPRYLTQGVVRPLLEPPPAEAP